MVHLVFYCIYTMYTVYTACAYLSIEGRKKFRQKKLAAITIKFAGNKHQLACYQQANFFIP